MTRRPSFDMHALTIACTDVTRTQDFYCELLGARVGYFMMIADPDGLVLEICQRDPD